MLALKEEHVKMPKLTAGKKAFVQKTDLVLIDNFPHSWQLYKAWRFYKSYFFLLVQRLKHMDHKQSVVCGPVYF